MERGRRKDHSKLDWLKGWGLRHGWSPVLGPSVCLLKPFFLIPLPSATMGMGWGGDYTKKEIKNRLGGKIFSAPSMECRDLNNCNYHYFFSVHNEQGSKLNLFTLQFLDNCLNLLHIVIDKLVLTFFKHLII